MNRYNELKHILQERCYFKVVCGAGNEDPEEVFKLAMVYTLAGANGIDVSANIDVVKSCMAGIDKAFELAPLLGREIKDRPFINVSVGLKGDPHVRKATIYQEQCTQCGLCQKACEQEAITENFIVLEYRCIGCGICAKVCPSEAIGFYHKKIDFNETLPGCLAAGAENLELHAIIDDDEAVIEDWKLINRLVPDNFISMCLDRSQLSNRHLIQRIKDVYDITGNRTIIQADGDPMSGGSDNFNTTLQAIAIADIVQKSKIPVMLLGSGGTNSKTAELARLCNVGLNGVSLGTYARRIVGPVISRDNFEDDISLIKEAVYIAEGLVEINLKFMKDQYDQDSN
ncbi:MAG: 4Fe-4S binding protein [Euryarchaeota archaeon]|nr:4Fe-4S binding protein [Euryarchaeota archaeon]